MKIADVSGILVKFGTVLWSMVPKRDCCEPLRQFEHGSGIIRLRFTFLHWLLEVAMLK
jgi:hypothetical protein